MPSFTSVNSNILALKNKQILQIYSQTTPWSLSVGKFTLLLLIRSLTNLKNKTIKLGFSSFEDIYIYISHADFPVRKASRYPEQ